MESSRLPVHGLKYRPVAPSNTQLGVHGSCSSLVKWSDVGGVLCGGSDVGCSSLVELDELELDVPRSSLDELLLDDDAAGQPALVTVTSTSC